MASDRKLVTATLQQEMDRRDRFGKLHVLIADRDHRTASLVQRLLFSFGFRNMDTTTDGDSALVLLRERPYDILITEWNMQPVDGLTLVKAIRAAKDDARIRQDVPIIMLTARADLNSVNAARDAGITEFVAKPFSAKTISSRMIQIIDSPRAFVQAPDFVGPCRRRRGNPPEGVEDRRGTGVKKAIVTPPNMVLKKDLGVGSAKDLLNEATIAQAQTELVKAEDQFIDWAREDILRLENAYAHIARNPADAESYQAMSNASYAIKSQAGIFGYPLGTEVATLMVEFLENHPKLSKENVVVLRKHIDAITVIFKQKIKDEGVEIAIDMVRSLKKLIEKLG